MPEIVIRYEYGNSEDNMSALLLEQALAQVELPHIPITAIILEPTVEDVDSPIFSSAEHEATHEDVTTYQQWEACRCGEHITVEGSESSVVLTCSRFRVEHRGHL
jgi:hypothetical protein